MDTSVKISTYGFEDNDCIASSKGNTTARTIRIDMSTFTAGTHYPNGILPKATVLALRASDKVYIAYNDAGSGGAATAVGVLKASIRVSNTGQAVTNTQAGALLWEGVLKPASAPFTSGVGALDAAAQADLAGKFYFIPSA